jgi:Bacterial archaeo-eukaryotic release factor family 10/eRF1 domain 3
MDHRVARFFEFHMGELTELDEKPYEVGQIANEQMHKGRGPDPDLYVHRLDAQYERLWKETAEHAASLSKEHGFAGIFLVGPERLVSSVQKHFASTAPVHVVTVHEDLGQFSSTDIRQRMEPLVAEYEQKLQLTEVQKLLAADAGSVSGVDEALAKLQQGMIGTLFVAEDHELHLRECSECRIVSRASDSMCGECGGERQNVGMFETLARLASAHDTRLEFVSGVAAETLAKSGGVGGWLRLSKKVALA